MMDLKNHTERLYSSLNHYMCFVIDITSDCGPYTSKVLLFGQSCVFTILPWLEKLMVNKYSHKFYHLLNHSKTVVMLSNIFKRLEYRNIISGQWNLFPKMAVTFQHMWIKLSYMLTTKTCIYIMLLNIHPMFEFSIENFKKLQNLNQNKYWTLPQNLWMQLERKTFKDRTCLPVFTWYIISLEPCPV